MLTITIVGFGNIAHHLAIHLFKSNSVKIKQVYSRDLNKIKHLSEITSITNSINDLQATDICIICVKDEVIEKVASKINLTNSLIVHTSGTTNMEVLSKHSQRGVFYPLQSFNKNKDINFSDVPLCIEANTSENIKKLNSLAHILSSKVYHISSVQRKKIHLAAVFVNNFVNHLYTIGEDICNTNDIPFDLLHPLIQETAQKISSDSPLNLQTGPAIRKDTTTIEAHINMLSEKQKDIYTLLSSAITNTHK